VIDNLLSKIRYGLNKPAISALHREHLFMTLMGAAIGVAVGYGAIGFRGLITAVAQLG